MGVGGNEVADKYGKEATKRNDIDINVSCGKTELKKSYTEDVLISWF